MKKGILIIFFINVFIISSRSQTLETCEIPGIKNEDNSYTFTALQNHTEKKLVSKLPGPIYTNLRYAEEVTVNTYIQYSYTSLNDSVRSNKQEEFFDANGNNIQAIWYNWWVIDNDWRPRYRTLSSFSDSGQLLIQLRDEWDNDAKVWKSHYKTSQENYSDTLSVYSCSVWQEDINDWLNQCRNEHYYDDNGNNTLFYQKIWEISINDWIIWSYFESEYNDNGEQILSTRYMYDSLIGDYILHSKTEYFQAQNENSFIDYTWDINSNDWIYSSKYQRFYDENGNLIMRYHYNFDLQNNNWNLISQADYEYDENANILLYTSRSWDEQDKITYSIMEESHYKENGNLRYKIIYSWNDEISEWQLDRKNFYYYSTVITSAKKAYNSSIIVYPNPSNSVLNISGENAKDAWIKIYSASGKFVESHFIKNNQLDISGLNPGIYFITIDDHIKEKFIKK